MDERVAVELASAMSASVGFPFSIRLGESGPGIRVAALRGKCSSLKGQNLSWADVGLNALLHVGGH